MTSPVTISGLSGIDTTTVITETLTAAAQPQQAEESQLGTVQTKDAAYQTINSGIAAIATAADNLTIPDTWLATTATSSDSSIVATGSTSALVGTATTFSVSALAKSQVSTIALQDASTAWNGTVTIGTHDFTSGSDNTATGLVTAINAANIGVKAALINTSSGTVMQLSSTTTGTAGAFTVTGSGLNAGSSTDGNGVTTANTLENLTDASDAEITVGTPSAGGYSITSSSNTFANAIPGVTFTVSALTTEPATITVASDPSSASSAVSSMVSAVNSALSLITDNTGQGEVLEGDSLVNNLTEQLLSAVSHGSTNGGASFTAAGLDINSQGQMTFDATAFAAAYAADPAGTESLVSNLASTFSGIANDASAPATGSLTQVISSDATVEANLNSEIADWTTKLADQKTALTNKYAAMDAALSKLQSEQSFLTSAFSSSSSSSSSDSLSKASIS